MIRTRRAIPGQEVWGGLSWNCGGSPSGSISYVADMRDPFSSHLKLIYWHGSGEERVRVEQLVRLTFTEPGFGGRRWWMICPFRGNRVAKLYLPNGGDRFAGRQAWRLGYQSQRSAHRDRPFDKLFRLQKKLQSEQGWEAPLRRPKGMHHRTFERHLERYLELDAECAVQMMSVIGILKKW